MYLTDFPHERTEVMYALKKLKVSEMRDPNKGPEEAMGNTVERNGREMKFSDYVLHTHSWCLPVDGISSMEAERVYIEDICPALGEALRTIQLSPPYQACLESAVSPKFWRMMKKQGLWCGRL